VDPSPDHIFIVQLREIYISSRCAEQNDGLHYIDHMLHTSGIYYGQLWG